MDMTWFACSSHFLVTLYRATASTVLLSGNRFAHVLCDLLVPFPCIGILERGLTLLLFCLLEDAFATDCFCLGGDSGHISADKPLQIFVGICQSWGGGVGFAPVKGAKPEVGGVRELEVAIAHARSFETSSFPIRPNPAPPFFPHLGGPWGEGCLIQAAASNWEL